MSQTIRFNKSRKRKLNCEVKLKDGEVDNTGTVEDTSDHEMHKMKIVKNENFLALVTLKGENGDVIDKSQESEQRAIIITETPSVPKLTRLKARELNNVPGMLMQAPPDMSAQYETTKLISEDFCSDEDDGDYLFKEEDFNSDEEPLVATSDADSNPYTSQNSQSDNSPVKFTDDGCFKIPCDRRDDAVEDLRISTRTRSKVCLENVAIEDIESEFIPPDVEYLDVMENDITANDTEWMEFLNEFSRPLNSCAIEEDDTINDPEYVATEGGPVDAEELRAVNISKKELADLFAELLDDLGNEGISLENIDLQPSNQEMGQKSQDSLPPANNFTVIANNVTADNNVLPIDMQPIETPYYECPKVVDNPIIEESLPNCHNDESKFMTPIQLPPFDGNYTTKYISVKKHIYNEYQAEFLNCMQDPNICHNNNNNNMVSNNEQFTGLQYELLQQQLRIHVQLLAQTFLQTYCHPILWRLAPQAENMLLELEKLSKTNANLRVCNLPGAVKIAEKWKADLNIDNEENKHLMNFLHAEIEATGNNSRQIQRFPPRLMELIVNSKVFMYPQYMPRMPFTSKLCPYHVFAPAENQLIAMGLEKYMREMESSGNFPKRADPLIVACERLCAETIFGKQKRRIWDHVKLLRKATYYNPIKYFFEHKCAPPIKHKLLPCDMKPPKQRFDEMPLAWQKYMSMKDKPLKSSKIKDKKDEIINLFDKLDFLLSSCKNIKSLNVALKKARRQFSVSNFASIKKRNKHVQKSFPRLKLKINKYKKLGILWNLRIYKHLKRHLGGSVVLPANHKDRPQLQQHIDKFIELSEQHRQEQELPFEKSQLLLSTYRRFKALQLYTSLLDELKMICTNDGTNANKATNCLTKRRRSGANCEEDGSPVIRNKKSSRQEENFRHMLMPDTPEDANRKDAVFAYNFYERVEETFISENRADDLKKFNTILKDFDPMQHKVPDLFHSIEELFMPDHPDLAEVFLAFLLPAEASEVGKFFEHFMINNVTTFISKLNIYFNKQPAQIKKIYNCLSELADEPDVTWKKVEMKILPLLKGNQFLIDWFQAQFPNAVPPDRILPQVEHINMKDKDYDGEIYENLVDSLYAPSNESYQQTSCQLRYINGRIYYGSKLTLPVKLSFLATHLNNKYPNQVPLINHNDNYNDDIEDKVVVGCVLGIREQGELCLTAEANSDENIETAADPPDDDDKSCEIKIEPEIEYEVCDQSTMRAHAIRLNPQYYACYATASHGAVTASAAGGSTPSHAVGKKGYVEESGDASPRKKTINSPTKKIKSPVAATVAATARRTHPMVVIPKANLAIVCAKKLKSLVEQEDECKTSSELNESQTDSIIAHPKKMARLEAIVKPTIKSVTSSSSVEKAESRSCAATVDKAWSREEDKIILMEMRSNCKDQTDLLERIHNKLPNRKLDEVNERYAFLMDFLSSLQRK